MYLTKMN